MNIKEIGRGILFYLSVPRCVGCRERLLFSEDTLCKKCLEKYNDVKERNCSLCGKMLYECSCSNEYLTRHYVHKVFKVFRYVREDPLPTNNLIYSLKRDNRSDVLNFLADELYKSLSAEFKNGGDFVFTNVPRRKAATIKYGIDHSALLAKTLAKRFSAEYYQPFISKTTKAQKKMMASERVKNARFEIKKNSRDFSKKTVIIVDDIITTGASMGAVAMLSRALGAKKIIGAAISIAYKDTYHKFDNKDRFKSK